MNFSGTLRYEANGNITTLAAAAKKGIVMGIQNQKNDLYRIIILFSMLLFAACLTMNVFLCGNCHLYELSDKAAVFETRTISEGIVTNKSGDDTVYFKSLFQDKNTSHTKTITKNTCPIPMNAAAPQGVSVLLFLIIVFPFFFLTLCTFLPDRWTLVHRKIRLDI